MGFFLTAGFLGMMYYFVPKQANRPIYSYRLSIVHFWSLIFLYIWAGPHHLHYTALPDWAQTLGMVFSIMLWMPSWGGMINGLMTLSGAWDKLRTDPIIRMMMIAVAFYGMSTFEGPVMSIRAVNSLSHYTDWTIGHVHSGALGWVGMISFGAIYFLAPKLWNRARLYSLRLVNWHFWLATIGIVLYASAMWVSGIMQGLMWREYDQEGFLVYSFVETVEAMHPYYLIRALGGLLYLAGGLLMAFNVWKTIRGDLREEAPMGAASPPPPSQPSETLTDGIPSRTHREERDAPPRPQPRGRRHRRHRRDRAALLPPERHREGRGRAALHAARARRPRHLHPRGLLRLPQPDDPADARRGRALRPLQPRRRVDVRPPLPVGLEAHRAGPRPGRRALFRRMARPAPDRPALAGADLDHAALRAPGDDASSMRENIAGHLSANAAVGVPYDEDMIANARADLLAQADPDADTAGLTARYGEAVKVGLFDGDPSHVTEMDALVAYLQMLGTHGRLHRLRAALRREPEVTP